MWPKSKLVSLAVIQIEIHEGCPIDLELISDAIAFHFIYFLVWSHFNMILWDVQVFTEDV